jgi:hypothetical protein
MKPLDRIVMIGKPLESVVFNTTAIFWQSNVCTRVAAAFLSVSTMALMGLTAAGGFGIFDKNG